MLKLYGYNSNMVRHNVQPRTALLQYQLEQAQIGNFTLDLYCCRGRAKLPKSITKEIIKG